MRATKKSSARAALMLSCLSCGACDLRSRWNEVRGDPYPLDRVERSADADAGIACDPSQLTTYEGTSISYTPPLRIAEPFEARLKRFEALVRQLGQEVYGRGPDRILNAGTYSCRTVAHRPNRYSEHALGNAIDVTGFHFPPTNEDAGTPLDLPERLQRAFTVTIAANWPDPENPDAAGTHHSRFFTRLSARLQDGPFRSTIGPTDPNHRTHLHLDMAPWRYMNL